jgi:hypothetical protein
VTPALPAGTASVALKPARTAAVVSGTGGAQDGALAPLGGGGSSALARRELFASALSTPRVLEVPLAQRVREKSHVGLMVAAAITALAT